MPLDFECTILLSKENIQVSSIKQSVELIINWSLQIDFGCVSRRHNRKKIHISIMAFELSSKTLGEPNESSLENSQRILRRAQFRRIFAAIFRAQRNIVRKFTRIRTIGVPKIRQNIAELSFEAKLRRKVPKSPEKPGNSSKCGSKTFGQYCTSFWRGCFYSSTSNEPNSQTK